MPKSFSVTTDQTNLSLVSERKGEAVFTVTNTTDRPRRAQLYLKPQGNTKESWFQIGGEMTREFSAKETHSVTVRAVIPNETPQGSYPFRLIVALDSDPDDVTEGPQVTIEVGKEVINKKFSWWIPVGIGVVFILLVLGIWKSGSSEIEIPTLINENIAADETKKKLEEFAVEIIEKPSIEKDHGIIIKQDPEPSDGKVEKGTVMKLTITTAVDIKGFWKDLRNNWYYEFTQDGPKVERRQYTYPRGEKTPGQWMPGVIERNQITVGDFTGAITAGPEGAAQSIHTQAGDDINRANTIPPENFVTIKGNYRRGESLLSFRRTSVPGRYKAQSKKSLGPIPNGNIPWKDEGEVEIRDLKIFKVPGGGDFGTIEKNSINDKGQAIKVNHDGVYFNWWH